MWTDSGAGALSLSSFVVHFITFILLFFVLGLFCYQYLRKRNNKPLSKIIAGLGIFLSIIILFINVLMTFGHIDFVQEQIEIVNDLDNYGGNNIIREGWIKDGYSNILWSIVESIILGLLPFWFFYHQYRRI